MSCLQKGPKKVRKNLFIKTKKFLIPESAEQSKIQVQTEWFKISGKLTEAAGKRAFSCWSRKWYEIPFNHTLNKWLQRPQG